MGVGGGDGSVGCSLPKIADPDTTQTLVTLLFGVSRLDPATYLGMMVLLFAVAGVACWVPASRAARVDPAITLRAQ